MPDSFPFPPEGPQSHDERALDSLLSGDTTDTPQALRPVADTLNALRAAPSARELQGEAAAREQFRALRAEALDDARGSRTLEMPAVPGQRSRGAQLRAARRRPFGVRLAGLTAVAAVLVLAVAATYTGNLPSRLQRIAHDTISAPPGGTATDPASRGVQASSASPVVPSSTAPAVSPHSSEAPASSSPSPQGKKKALCDQFWSDLEHSRPGGTSWQTPRYRQLITAAGGAQKVFGYCYPVWDPKYAPQYRQLPSYPPYFPKNWGSEGSQGNGPGQQQPGGPGGQQQPGPGQQQPQPGSTGGPQTPNAGDPGSGPGAGQGQGQGSGSAQN